MGAQSFIMMFQAGEGWQYGKRRISAMSNEDFNKLTPERLLQNQAATLRSSIGTIEKSMNAMTPMIGTIIHQYADFARQIVAQVPKELLAFTGGKTPEAIMSQLVPNAPPTERDALVDFFKSLLNPLPSVGAETGVISTSSGATIIHASPPSTSKIHGPGLQTVKTKFISRQAQAIIDAKAATFKESFSQQIGSTGAMSIGKKRALTVLTSMEKQADTHRGIIKSATGKTSQGAIQKLNINKRILAQLEKRIVFQKIKINRMKF